MLFRVGVSAITLLCGVALGQTTSENPAKFDLADIHASPHTTQPFVRGPFYNGGRYELRFATMLDLIHTAYGVDPEKVVGGSGSGGIAAERCDLAVRCDHKATRAEAGDAEAADTGADHRPHQPEADRQLSTLHWVGWMPRLAR